MALGLVARAASCCGPAPNPSTTLWPAPSPLPAPAQVLCLGLPQPRDFASPHRGPVARFSCGVPGARPLLACLDGSDERTPALSGSGGFRLLLAECRLAHKWKLFLELWGGWRLGFSVVSIAPVDSGLLDIAWAILFRNVRFTETARVDHEGLRGAAHLREVCGPLGKGAVLLPVAATGGNARCCSWLRLQGQAHEAGQAQQTLRVWHGLEDERERWQEPLSVLCGPLPRPGRLSRIADTGIWEGLSGACLKG